MTVSPPGTHMLLPSRSVNTLGTWLRECNSKGSVTSCCKEDFVVPGSEAAKFTALTDLIDPGSSQNGSNILQRPALHMAHISSIGLFIVLADAAAALGEEVQKPRRPPAGHDRPHLQHATQTSPETRLWGLVDLGSRPPHPPDVFHHVRSGS